MPTEPENICCREITQSVQVFGLQELRQLVLGLSGPKDQGGAALLCGPTHKSRVP
ncbi:3-isopropylmalate dehydratase large subunit [Labeo rohita]|uniref:3-isopropylmalate dehydratase large subunit n=1 Tax=Labeo rohita TaxID=84645 RepID=A0ABQ8L085_LABRO|nr:3-isopropylmalate dehydratase large subunit [Labeo rohita]